MNDQQNQLLEIKHVFLVVSVVGLCGFLFFPSWTRSRAEDKQVTAQRQAEVLGYQVFEIYHEASVRHATLLADANSGPKSRSPASLDEVSLQHESGSIGSDPWGQPFRYKIVKVNKGLLKVQIWSAGANKNFETADLPGAAADTYAGDDVGILLSMTAPTNVLIPTK